MERIERRGLPGSALKWIAIVCMLLDHVGAAPVYGLAAFRHAWGAGLLSLQGYYALRVIGRLGFPLFCFLLAEGFVHTRSRGRYLARLGLFALLSELPFDLALRGAWKQLGDPALPFLSRIGLESSGQNVFFTLFFGLLAVWLWEELTLGRPADCGAARRLCAVLCASALAAAAYFLKTDYGAMGVVLILALYLLRGRPWLRDLAALAALAAMLLFGSHWIELFGAAAFPLFHLYNGKRGRQPKVFFYLFYPAHLLLLALLQRCLFSV